MSIELGHIHRGKGRQIDVIFESMVIVGTYPFSYGPLALAVWLRTKRYCAVPRLVEELFCAHGTVKFDGLNQSHKGLLLPVSGDLVEVTKFVIGILCELH